MKFYKIGTGATDIMFSIHILPTRSSSWSLPIFSLHCRCPSIHPWLPRAFRRRRCRGARCARGAVQDRGARRAHDCTVVSTSPAACMAWRHYSAPMSSWCCSSSPWPPPCSSRWGGSVWWASTTVRKKQNSGPSKEKYVIFIGCSPRIRSWKPRTRSPISSSKNSRPSLCTSRGCNRDGWMNA